MALFSEKSEIKQHKNKREREKEPCKEKYVNVIQTCQYHRTYGDKIKSKQS